MKPVFLEEQEVISDGFRYIGSPGNVQLLLRVRNHNLLATVWGSKLDCSVTASCVIRRRETSWKRFVVTGGYGSSAELWAASLLLT